ncbi:hypothetical protein N836_27770 [Leptolyngbya sp. Heron Island J]|uniref:hypothetical protein n=1 Tax=Leptolyngbya sp. Heron Island J TaxID=1385935 RepID=UPI0003B9F3DF|nr:hypothetical protein [Leptolyngbya sp. Heron Island J]ESA32392.1 hypothetical protein N836_27770 [Leptolyngbya sp. Heron Island J]
MSEYQYYEFQAIDRPLTAKEQTNIQKLSSRVELTPHRAVFLYNYGDFRGNPEEIVTKYFDIMFYIANWGTRQLIFRFPKAIVDPGWYEPYELPYAITSKQTKEYVVLNININDEDGSMSGWVDGEGWLPQLLPLRDQLLTGDVRLLYIAWLRAVPNCAGYDIEKDPIEPPIPPNLGKLSAPLETFIDLVELNPDLFAAAAEASQKTSAKSKSPSLEAGLANLPASEKEKFLLKLVRREPHVDLQLINRLKQLAGPADDAPRSVPGYRRLSELTEMSDAAYAKRQQKEQEAAQRKRIKELKTLASKKEQLWQQVVVLIETKQAKPYDEATALLKDLRDLAEYQKKLPDFIERFNGLQDEYQNRPALMRRFRTIEL